LSDEALAPRPSSSASGSPTATPLADLAPKAFAVVREAARRTLKMRHFDVQLIGGLTLHEGRIAEMRTGEGKTLMSTLAAYLNALPGEASTSSPSTNTSRARRGLDGPIYRFLGSRSASSATSRIRREARRVSLRHHLRHQQRIRLRLPARQPRVQPRGSRAARLAFAIVDEVDSILIDEARTPLIISGPAEENTELYLQGQQAGAAPQSSARKTQARTAPGDYTVDEKQKQTHLTEAGHEHVEQLMLEPGLLREGESLYDPAEHPAHASPQRGAARAVAFYKRDVEYIVRDGESSSSTNSRAARCPAAAGPDGLHQAVEAKEGVKVRAENQTVASITFQNYFRLYKKLSGMTGTAETEAPESRRSTVSKSSVIPTHSPMIRKDNSDFVYLDAERQVQRPSSRTSKDCVTREQPGARRHHVHRELRAALGRAHGRTGIPHEVLNAEAARARGAHRRERRHAGQGDHRHQHGGPRNRHQTRRQQRSRARAGGRGRG
jgi:preprotein translocase subunit SecA